MLFCRTLGEAIQCSIDFCEIIYPRAGHWSLKTERGWALFTYRAIRKRYNDAACLLQTIGLLIVLWQFEWLIGESLHPRKVIIGYRHREPGEPLLALFDAPVVLVPLDYGFEFSEDLLLRPLVRQGADIDQFLELLQFRIIGLSPSTPSLRKQILFCLDSAMLKRGSLSGLDEIARVLGTSATTLRRRLRDEGCSFKAIRNDFLKARAGRYLRETSLGVNRISDQLGFSNSSVFRRAFVRWHGCSPSEYRREASGRAG